MVTVLALLGKVVFDDLRDDELRGILTSWIAWMFVVLIAMQSTGVVLSVRLSMNGLRSAAIDVVMMSPLLATAVLSLITFSGDAGPGWWLTLFVTLAWLAEWGFLWWMSRRSGTRIA